MLEFKEVSKNISVEVIQVRKENIVAVRHGDEANRNIVNEMTGLEDKLESN